jgi:nodulation protein E
MLVLENWDHAVARGADILGEIIGFGMSSDAHHITQPCVNGPAKAMQWALQDAGIRPDQVGYINAHGTGTAANDATETSAIQAVFGERHNGLLVSSTKSMHGHTLGAAGAIEAVATLLALKHGVVPPTVNFGTPDPACNLNIVRNEPQAADIQIAMSNTFAFGGLNATLVMKKA